MKHKTVWLTTASFLVPLYLVAFNVFLADSLKTEPEPKTRKVKQEPEKATHTYRVQTVVVDAGHGGHDPGCLGASSREKHLALAISLRVAERLREAFPDLRVILTRDKDVFVPLHERAAIANRNQADLFISIHCNYMPKLDWVHGSETYVMGLHTAEHNLQVAKRENSAILLEADYEQNYDYDPNSPEGHIMLSMFQNAYLEQSIQFAEKVEANFEQVAQRKSRGVKQAGFVVLKETAMPSVLVESGFLSNRDEEAFLKDAAGQDEVARVIVRAFAEYKREVEYDALAEAGSPETPQKPEKVEPQLPRLDEKPVVAEGSPEPEPPAAVLPEPTVRPVAAKPVSVAAPTGEDLVAQANSQQKRSAKGPMPSPVLEQPVEPSSKAGAGLPALTASGGSPVPKAAQPVAAPAPQRATGTPSVASLNFRVQIAASPQPLLVTDQRWGLITQPVELVEEDRLYKYQVCGASNLEEAVALRRQMQRAGFMDAFVVIYRGKERISLEEAQQWTAQP